MTALGRNRGNLSLKDPKTEPYITSEEVMAVGGSEINDLNTAVAPAVVVITFQLHNTH